MSKLRALAAAWLGPKKPTKGASVPFVITSTVRQRLGDLGYTGAEIKRLTPAVALQIVDRGWTPDQLELAKTKHAMEAGLDSDAAAALDAKEDDEIVGEQDDGQDGGASGSGEDG